MRSALEGPQNPYIPVRPLGEHLAGGQPGGEPHGGITHGAREQLYTILDLVYRGKWVVIVSFLVILTLTTVITFTISPEYESYGLVYVDAKQTSEVGQVIGIGEGGSQWFFPRVLNNEVVILKQSEEMAENVARKLMALGKVPDTDAPLTILEPKDPEEPVTLQTVADRLQSTYITARQEDFEVDVLRITATSTVPAEAALLANLYLDEYERRNQQTSRERYVASRRFLEAQESKLSKELIRLESEIEAYMDREGTIAPETAATQAAGQITLLETKRDEAVVDLQVTRITLASLEAELGKIEPMMVRRIASSARGEIKTKLDRIAELELAQIPYVSRHPELEQDPSGNPDYLKIVQELARLRQEVAQLAKQEVTEILAIGGVDVSDPSGQSPIADMNRQIIEKRIEISGLEAKVNQLDQRIAEYEAELQGIPEQLMDLAQLERAQKSTESTYLFVLEKLHEARLAEESEPGYIEVIRRARSPVEPVRPNKKLNLAIGGFLGVVFGLVLAIISVLIDKRLYRPEDLRKKGFNLLGTAPNLLPFIKATFGGAAAAPFEGRQVSTRLVPLLAPHAPVVEHYRQMHTNIQFSRPDLVVQTILVASSCRGEGRTTTAANLALVMAESGRRTLLVDADLHHPDMHTLFGLPEGMPGLVDFLAAPRPASIDSLATGVKGLYVMPAGSAVPNPAVPLSSPRVRELIQYLREQVDVIVFDSSPVLTGTSAALLATQCDATVLVTLAGKTEEQELEQSWTTLKGVGAMVVGLLLNGFEPAMAHGYKYKYKSYKYK